MCELMWRDYILMYFVEGTGNNLTGTYLCRIIRDLPTDEYRPLLYKIVCDDTEYVPTGLNSPIPAKPAASKAVYVIRLQGYG